MKPLRYYFTLFGIANALFLFSSASYASNSQPPLWQQAVEIATTQSSMMPGTVNARSEELDGKGKVKHIEETQTRIWLDNNGQLQEETVTYRDGKQTPNSKEEEGEESNDVNAVPDFLKPEFQSQVNVNATGERKVIDGRTCVAHEFMRKGKDGEQGIAWLDEETGAVMEAQFKPMDMPTGVKRMDSVLRFAYQNNAWYLTEMNLDVFASAIVFKGGARVTVSLSDHFPYTIQ